MLSHSTFRSDNRTRRIIISPTTYTVQQQQEWIKLPSSIMTSGCRMPCDLQGNVLRKFWFHCHAVGILFWNTTWMVRATNFGCGMVQTYGSTIAQRRFYCIMEKHWKKNMCSDPLRKRDNQWRDKICPNNAYIAGVIRARYERWELWSSAMIDYW